MMEIRYEADRILLESKDGTNNIKKELKLNVYKETSSGYTSALQMVDTTNMFNFFPNTTDASYIIR